MSARTDAEGQSRVVVTAMGVPKEVFDRWVDRGWWHGYERFRRAEVPSAVQDIYDVGYGAGARARRGRDFRAPDAL